MENMDSVIERMDFDSFANGENVIGLEGARRILATGNCVFLDVRSPEEVRYNAYPFAVHIPLNELPRRAGELPRDKCIVPFCSSVFRASVAFLWLSARGFAEVRTLVAGTEDLATLFKPGMLSSFIDESAGQ